MDVELTSDLAPTHPRVRVRAIAHAGDHFDVNGGLIRPGERPYSATEAVSGGEIAEHSLVERDVIGGQAFAGVRKRLGARLLSVIGLFSVIGLMRLVAGDRRRGDVATNRRTAGHDAAGSD